MRPYRDDLGSSGFRENLTKTLLIKLLLRQSAPLCSGCRAGCGGTGGGGREAAGGLPLGIKSPRVAPRAQKTLKPISTRDSVAAAVMLKMLKMLLLPAGGALLLLHHLALAAILPNNHLTEIFKLAERCQERPAAKVDASLQRLLTQRRTKLNGTKCRTMK